MAERRKSGRLVRPTEWTAAKRETFLDRLAATCNARQSILSVGMSWEGAYALRRRDGEFAEQWRQAQMAGYEAMEGELIAHAMGTRSPDAPAIDPEMILRLLAFHRNSLAGTKKPGGPPLKRVSREELEATILARLAAMDKKAKKSA